MIVINIMDEIEIIEDALRRAYSAFNEVRKRKEFNKRISIGYGGDITLFFDEYVEKAIINNLKGKVAKVLSEEKGLIECEGKEYLAIIDPVDGSTNTSREIPFSATTITLSKGRKFEEIVASGTIDLVHGEMFMCDGSKVLYNGNEAKPSIKKDLKEAIASIDMKITKENLIFANRLIRISEGIRYLRFLGAIALELAYVACGRIDAFIVPTPRVRLLDIIGGLFMVKTVKGYAEILEEEITKIDLLDNRRFAVLAAGNEELAMKIRELLYSNNQ